MRKSLRLNSLSPVKGILAGLYKKPLKKTFQCAAEGRIDDDHLAPPQAQNLPDDGADVVHIHLLYDSTRLDVLFKSIPQSIKFVRRFGDEQRQFRQKCQFVCPRHLLTPMNLLEVRAQIAPNRTAAGESVPHCR